VPLDK